MCPSHLKRIRLAEIRARTGHEILAHPTIAHLKDGKFRIINRTVAGDAPKDFFQVYEHGAAHRSAISSWPKYIAKVGHKWYPNESITEHLLTRIGQLLQLDIADSRLMFVRGQLRFLSRYFLRADESLIHGAEIFAGHLADEQFVREVEEKKMSRDVFTFQVVEEAIKSRFPVQADVILPAFVRMLGFDAVVGNNDRHYFNWGVVTDLKAKRSARFAPIYDTARALFWDGPEWKLEQVDQNKRRVEFVRKYVEECMPKTGWDGKSDLNHFGLVQLIANERPTLAPVLKSLCTKDLAARVNRLIGTEFASLFSPRRREFILECLNQRVHSYVQAVGV
ncbi:MAG TPA: HipA domain-containing protein [Chthoniobacterales bacterium]|nr:HipA domain-containing protein [Chthoniobacterales bacterium]